MTTPTPDVNALIERLEEIAEGQDAYSETKFDHLNLAPILRDAAQALRTLQARVGELEEVQGTFLYLCKWVERGLFDKHHNAVEAMTLIAHFPGMPWKQGRWDVDHKEYAEAFYTAFPKARTLTSQEAQRHGE